MDVSPIQSAQGEGGGEGRGGETFARLVFHQAMVKQFQYRDKGGKAVTILWFRSQLLRLICQDVKKLFFSRSW
jgi:hypothetical protein